MKCIGVLPAGGEWKFLHVSIEEGCDIIIIMDMTGQHSPRMINANGKLIEVPA